VDPAIHEVEFDLFNRTMGSLMTGQVGLFPRATDDVSLVEWGRRAEQLGYDAVWIGEGWDHDVFVKLSEIATVTDTVRLGSGIANVYTRTPTVLTMAAASLQRASDGRFLLGLGASHPTLVKQYHGLEYSRPIRRLREAIDVIAGLTGDGEPFSYDGEIFQLRDVPRQGIEVPVYNAAIGESNRRLTGRSFDGWIPYGIPFPALADAYEAIESAVTRANRTADAVTVLPWVTAAVADDESQAREAVRDHIVTFVGRFDAYRRAFAQEYPDASSRIFRTVDEGRDGVRGLITDEMVDTFGIVGRPDSARRQLQTILEIDTIDGVVLTTPRTATDAVIERTITTLGPEP